MSWEDLKYIIPAWVAVVTAIGWVVNDWLKRRATANQLMDKKIDYMRALSAEIKSYANSRGQSLDDLDRAIERARGSFGASDGADYVPFVPSEKHDAVFEAIVHDIHVLPSRTIYPVVVYYSQIRSIRDLATDMRTPDYAGLSAEQRESILIKHLEMIRYSYILSRKAVHALSDQIKLAERKRKRPQ